MPLTTTPLGEFIELTIISRVAQIFGLMHPRDLLNLARTSKAFRAFLLSRVSEPFWRAARGQVEGLPQCPNFLSEPAYANLVFFSHCHASRSDLELESFR